MSRLNSSQVTSSVLGYVQITGTVSTTSTSQVQATGLTLTVTVPTLVGNQRVEIEFYCRDAFTSGGGIMDVGIWDGTVNAGTLLEMGEPNMPNGSATPCYVKCSITPTAGSHTYNIGISRGGAGTQANIEAATTYPAWMQVKVV